MTRTRCILAALLTTCLVALTPLPASAVSCSASSGIVKIVLGDDETGTVVRGGGGEILVGGAGCDGATVTNTEQIAVASTDGTTTFRIDLSGGPFARGRATSREPATRSSSP
jgi:hypothetical protein